MEQYIPKAAVVAEIEKLDNFWHLSKGDSGRAFVENLLSFLNTLEVKEVDLKREIEKEIETRWHGEYLFTEKFKESAKHFFELGLKAQKEE